MLAASNVLSDQTTEIECCPLFDNIWDIESYMYISDHQISLWKWNQTSIKHFWGKLNDSMIEI